METEVKRVDIGTIREFQESSEGFITAYLTFSKIGPLSYLHKDGTEQVEWVDSDCLYEDESLISAANKPVTLNHPPVWLTADNTKDYARGFTGQKVIKETPFATIVATVFDTEAIQAVKSGRAKQVSAGYTAKLIKKDDGLLYQSQRRYNHLSLVSIGRAGAEVKAHFDDSEDVAIQVLSDRAESQNDTSFLSKGENTVTINSIRIDDKTTISVGSSEGEQAIAKYLRDALDANTTIRESLAATQLKADKTDKLETDTVALQAKHDQEKARADMAEAKLAEANKKTDEAATKIIFDQGYQRSLLEIAAAKYLPAEVKIDSTMSDRTIKLNVIKHQQKLKADSDEAKYYDSESDAYVDAAYRFLLKQDSSTGLKIAAVTAQPEEKQDAGEMARAAYIERLKKKKKAEIVAGATK